MNMSVIRFVHSLKTRVMGNWNEGKQCKGRGACKSINITSTFHSKAPPKGTGLTQVVGRLSRGTE